VAKRRAITLTSMNFPFTAIVGQPQLKTALLLCAVDPSLGGVLIRGDKGTAKSTAARALTEVLPPIVASPVARTTARLGSRPNIAKSAPAQRLNRPACRSSRCRSVRPKIACLVRSICSVHCKAPNAHFKPGLLAAAHRGILYIDEVNLLPDHLVDVLLDVAAMGVNSVQREGLSITHPARFALIGTMNLEEGDLASATARSFRLDGRSRPRRATRRCARKSCAAALHSKQIKLVTQRSGRPSSKHYAGRSKPRKRCCRKWNCPMRCST
jgi:predicted ATPase with chaperone activity